MADASNLQGKLGIDTGDFQNGIRAANRELKTLESGFRAGVSAMGNWANSASGLEARAKTLTAEIGVQQQKIALLNQQYQQLVQDQGENSVAAQNQQIKINNATEALGKMQSELDTTNTALQDTTTDEKQAGQATENSGDQAQTASQHWENFKNTVNGVMGVVKAVALAIVGLATAVAGVAGALIALEVKAAGSAHDLEALSAQTGISKQRLQELNFVGQMAGVSLDTIASSQARLVRAMGAAERGTKTSVAAFKELGINIYDSNGHLRNQNDVFAEALTKLGQMKDATQADVVAQELFGRNAMELNPLIKLGADGIAQYSDQAEKLGAVVDDQTLDALSNLQDQFDAFKLGLQGIGMTLAGALAPFFGGAMQTALGYLTQLSQIVKGSGGDFGKLAQGLAGMFTEIAKNAASSAPQMLKAGLAVVQAILTAIISALPSLLDAAVQIIHSLIDFIVQNLPMLIHAAVQIVVTLANAIIPLLPELVNAGLQAIVYLVAGLSQALPSLIPAIVKVIPEIVKVLIQNMPALIAAGAMLLIAIAQGIVDSIPPKSQQAMRDFVQNLVVSIAYFIIDLFALGKQIVETIHTGILTALTVLDLLGQLIYTRIRTAVVNMIGSIQSIGQAIVQGVWQGIQNDASWFQNQISNFFGNMVTSVKNSLGIQSPSKVFAGIGSNVIQGFAQGAQDEFAKMQAQLAVSFGGLTALPALAGGAAAGSVSTQNESFQFFAPVIVQGATPTGSLGATLKGKRF
jgi:hypothetical protein